MQPEPFSVLSLFSGIGMHDLGLQRAGMTIAGQCEIDPFCQAVLEKHWPGMPRWEDVKNVTGKSVLERCGRIDLLTGGFPCQDISVAGKNAGIRKGTRSGLWREMFRVVRQVKPTWLLVENVPALKTRGYDGVVDALARIGYAVFPSVVGAWATGLPHKRDRVWIVCRNLAVANGIGGRNPDRETLREGRRPAEKRKPDVSHRPEREEGESDGDPRDASGDCAELLADPERPIGRPGFAGGFYDDDSSLRLRANGEEDASWAGTLGEELADTKRGAGSREWESAGMGRRVEGSGEHSNLARPARPGEPQHGWEASRLIELPLGGSIDGVPVRLVRSANRNALKALGNGNPPHVPELIGRWILAQEGGRNAA